MPNHEREKPGREGDGATPGRGVAPCSQHAPDAAQEGRGRQRQEAGAQARKAVTMCDCDRPAGAKITKQNVAAAIWAAMDDLYSEGYHVSGGAPDETDVMTLIDGVQSRLFPESRKETLP